MNSALVTGASGGIGNALCQEFRTAGYRVIGLDRVTPQCDVDAFVQGDIVDLCSASSRRESLVRKLLDATGSRLRVLVNNAAVQVLGSASETSQADWDITMRTNVQVPFVLTQLLLPALEAAAGSVVNIASIHAVATKPGFVAYATSKAALVGLTRALAVDLCGRIRVNAILPAAIDTPMLREGFAGRTNDLEALRRMHPSGRLGKPAEIARTAVFLASAEAEFANGAVWNVDGGIGGRLHDPV